MDKICISNIFQNNVILMLFDMNTDLLENKWIIPNIKNLLDEIEKIDIKKIPLADPELINMTINWISDWS